MSATLQTRPSTRPLSEVAKHLVYPDDIVTTGWPRVRAQCAAMGIRFDGWQDGLGTLALGKRADGRYAAGVGGVYLSIPRQVGKTYLVGAMVLALCILIPGLTVLWTAHRKPTAMMTLEKLKGLARRKQVRPHIAKIKTGNNEGSIKFRNGSLILFGARDLGFGRGYDEVDVEVFDECQILTEKALEDIIPAANQSRQPTGALVFFMGTPPRPTDPGEVFTARRDEALSGEAESMIYVEMGATEGTDPASWGRQPDWEQIAAANPSYPDHTPKDAILRMVKMLPSLGAIRREALGLWDDKTAARTIPESMWSPLAVAEHGAPHDGLLGYGVMIRGDAVCLAACIAPEDEPPHVEILEHRPLAEGVDWLADWLDARKGKKPLVAIDGLEGADLLRDELRKKRFPTKYLLKPTVAQVVDAHVTMLDAIRTGDLTHLDQPLLNGAVAVAGKRNIGTRGGWGWIAVDDGDVLPLEAATWARYAAGIQLTRAATRRGRKVVVHG